MRSKRGSAKALAAGRQQEFLERRRATLLRAEAKEVQRWGLTVKEPAKGAT